MIKHNKATRTFFNALVENQETIRELLNKREDTYDNRSEAWQESDKGEEYMTDNENLSQIMDLIDELESLFTETFD